MQKTCQRRGVFMNVALTVLLVMLGAVLYGRRQELKDLWRYGLQNPPPAAEAPLVAEDPVLLEELRDAALLDEKAPAASAGWPQWRGPGRNGWASGENVARSWPEKGPALSWQKKTGESYSAFVGDRQRIYTMVREENNEVVLCWELNTGKEVWRFAYDCTFRDGNGNGPRSTPTLADGKLYTVGSTGLFHCLDAATGKVVYGHDLLKKFQAPRLGWGICFSPLVEGDLVFTNPGGPSGGSLAAFYKDTGELAWHGEDDPAGYSSPVSVTHGNMRQIVFFTGQRLVGVAAKSGKLLWHFPWVTGSNVNAATPIMVAATRRDGQALLYAYISSNYGKGCALLKIENAEDGSFAVRPVYGNTEMKNHFATCVRDGEHLFGFDDGTLVCQNLRTGHTAWKKSGFNKGTLLRVGDQLVILGETGKLALARAQPQDYEELAAFKPLQRRCWTMPVLIDGRLLVRDEETVKCFDMRVN